MVGNWSAVELLHNVEAIMNPLTAAGLAGNIIQFVDFASKVISGSRALYISTTGWKQETWKRSSLQSTYGTLRNGQRSQNPSPELSSQTAKRKTLQF
jgi:hypothetical protein